MSCSSAMLHPITDIITLCGASQTGHLVLSGSNILMAFQMLVSTFSPGDVFTPAYPDCNSIFRHGSISLAHTPCPPADQYKQSNTYLYIYTTIKSTVMSTCHTNLC